MLNCKDMTKLISDSLEQRLTFRQRMEMRLHILACGLCRKFRDNSLLLRKAAGSCGDPDPTEGDDGSVVDQAATHDATPATLSPAAKRRILTSISQAHRD